MTDIRGLLTDDDAVSPVIGVILMVAVTVVLSAAVGAFVLDIGNAVTEQSPTAVIEFEYDISTGSGTPNAVVLRHNGGDELATSTLRVTVDGTVAWEDKSSTDDFATGGGGEWDDGVTSGDELRIEEDGADIEASSSVQLVWQEGQRSSVLASSDD
ncbi:type IV pilin N-terminal domain-containing protein [Halorubellus sp. PRR65]|uniref:type IV pilin N-terminal domain-containing protein n=1 Tax=Halorubellus sp. PRR65 TaxID=3098148 RepID=UPI002B260CF4|nr:type IV pilin N-terminal domain-containing protein [Halorubellus sp. PRR65]